MIGHLHTYDITYTISLLEVHNPTQYHFSPPKMSSKTAYEDFQSEPQDPLLCDALKMSLTTAQAWTQIGGISAADDIATHVLDGSLDEASTLNLAATVSNGYFLLRQYITSATKAPELVNWATTTYPDTDERGKMICRRILFLCSSERIEGLNVATLAKGLELGLTDLQDQLEKKKQDKNLLLQHLREILSGFVCLITVYKTVREDQEKQTSETLKQIVPHVLTLATQNPELLYPCIPIISCRPDVAVESQKLFVTYLETLEVQLKQVLCATYPDITALAQLLYGLAPLVPIVTTVDGAEPAREILCRVFLPSDEDRKEAIGKTKSIPSRLLKVTEEPEFQDCKFLVNEAQWVLCEENKDKFTDAIGFGYAAGYLTGFAASSASTGPASNSGFGYDKVTGQKLTPELQELKKLQEQISAMSPEEKEREAEKLMYLFNRMKELGIVNFDHPMRAAQESGRFEELD
ncbi:YALIA101S03e04566g1_1 [Yarrowia lipolytica]|nr:YALIA101S03e04566g1_1 [Yarrowia lipolytica]